MSASRSRSSTVACPSSIAMPTDAATRRLAGAEPVGAGEALADAAGDLQRLVPARDVLADDDELVAAEAGDRVTGAHAALEPAGDEEQQLVAGLVAEVSFTCLNRSRSTNRSASSPGPAAPFPGGLHEVAQAGPVGRAG